jgi:outer membrane protein assembly factor BamE (lipoprotein component of BamABCDE complex)
MAAYFALQRGRHRRKACVVNIGNAAAWTMIRTRHFDDNEGLRAAMVYKKALTIGMVAALGVGLAGCSSIRESRGYVVDGVLLNSVQAGIDNQRSVEATLGRPTFTSQYGDKTWYYVSSVTGRRPFVRPKIDTHSVLAVRFDAAGNVISTQRTGPEQIAFLSPDGDKTPTLGRERTFLEDLFGNIGQVGAGGPGGGPGGP